MPRKYRAAKGRQAPLTLEVLDVLLGHYRTPASIARLAEAGVEYDGFAVFDLDKMPADTFRELWGRHEHEIRREAARRHVPVPDPAGYLPGQWPLTNWNGD